MCIRAKKSQTTIFLILWVVMIIIVITLILVRNYSVKKILEKEIICAKEVAFYVQPILPVKKYGIY